MAQAKLKYMIGTEGRPDYLVLAKRGAVSFGIKGLVRPLPDGYSFFMVRLRSALLSSDVIDHDKEPMSDKDHAKLWNVQFSQCHSKRASTIVGVVIRNVDATSPSSVWASANLEVVDQIMDFLKDRGLDSTVSISDIRDSVQTQWLKNYGFNKTSKMPKLKKDQLLPRRASGVVYYDQLNDVCPFLQDGKNAPTKASDAKTFKKTMPKAQPKLKVVVGGGGKNVVNLAAVKAAKAKAKKTKLKLVAKKTKATKATKKAPAKKAVKAKKVPAKKAKAAKKKVAKKSKKK